MQRGARARGWRNTIRWLRLGPGCTTLRLMISPILIRQFRLRRLSRLLKRWAWVAWVAAAVAAAAVIRAVGPLRRLMGWANSSRRVPIYRGGVSGNGASSRLARSLSTRFSSLQSQRFRALAHRRGVVRRGAVGRRNYRRS